MAKFAKVADFLDENVAIVNRRINSQYSAFLDSKPTFCTYYHINEKLSTTDKGLKDTERLIEDGSPTRYNKIKKFPIYGIEEMNLSLNEADQGFDTEFEGEGVILPNTIYPMHDDHFTIDYLGNKYLFRVTKIDYDTIKSNNFYKISYALEYAQEKYTEELNRLVVGTYHCIYDNIGTKDKCIIRDAEYDILIKIEEIYDMIKSKYLEKYLDKRYNALMYVQDSQHVLYDSMLNVFCNQSRIFADENDELNTFLLYEERRPYHGMDFEDSIYDRLLHKDTKDIEDINKFYFPQPAISTDSVFDYYRDPNAKYLSYYPTKDDPLGQHLIPYLPKDFCTALQYGNDGILKDPYEKLIWTYMYHGAAKAAGLLNTVNIRRIKYNLHTFIFVPMTLYVLRQMLKEILVNNTIMDEELLDENV
jgi:hypothetical protein